MGLTILGRWSAVEEWLWLWYHYGSVGGFEVMGVTTSDSILGCKPRDAHRVGLLSFNVSLEHKLNAIPH